MAVMWPKALPQEVLRNTLRSTECEVYRRLETELDHRFVVFYSRPWLGLTPAGEEIDGECDFVVAHPELGLLTLEVKGGAVSYDPTMNKWSSVDRWKVRHSIRNPVHQARASKHQILKKLAESMHWRPRRISAVHGVVLPHSAKPPNDLGADRPREIFCFLEDFESDLGGWIKARMGQEPEPGAREEPLGADGIRALEKLLAQPFQLRTPLGHLLGKDDKELELLTQQQFYILAAIEGIQRAAVCGGAGTGKTVLAIEEAKRCVDRGMRTLFTCYNRALAADVTRRVGVVGGLTVSHFHELSAHMASKAGVHIPRNLSQERLFAESLPEALMQAIDRQPQQRFDAIIVDEGQDFLPLWWSAMMRCSRRP